VYSTILIATTIAAAAPTRRVARLVDVGSGDSPYRGVLEHDLYVGIDRNPRGSDALLATADAAALPLVSASADGLLCTEVIEHVPDEHQLAAELARVATPGACLVLSAPFVHGLHEQPYDFRRLTSIGLVTTLEAAGWRVDHIRPIGGPLVVAIDGIVRWFDTQLRRLGRVVTTPESAAFRVITAPSAAVQRGLAELALSRGRSFGAIDPYRPSPRLTLGYVVAATLPEAADRVR
jgi:SAM-dependent methyltransferase